MLELRSPTLIEIIRFVIDTIMRKMTQKKQSMYICPFCKKNIASSKKTEVFYRSNWVDGCFECFDLSIAESNIVGFQEKTY